MSTDLTVQEQQAFHAPAPAVFDPHKFEVMARIANIMAGSKLVPECLQGKPDDCFLVTEQADRWGMSPFAVAQCASVVKGKLLFEGKLVTAVVNASSRLQGGLRFTFEGTGQSRAVICSGTLKGETEPRIYRIEIAKAQAVAGNSTLWKTDPEQQSCYFAARFWARRHLPEVMLGVYGPDEYQGEAPAEMKNITPATESRPAAPPDALVEVTATDGEVFMLPPGPAKLKLKELINELADGEDFELLWNANKDLIKSDPVLKEAMKERRDEFFPPQNEQQADLLGAGGK
ncbi:recombinase RecT [Geminicoccus harenae]|uniref:recombinase RecT n=1 Tax=Geminicoccus harenae TaxID=2498453 RepID=UPI00168ADA17|nr:recombinase RecT [Geminicoccus harenae]